MSGKDGVNNQSDNFDKFDVARKVNNGVDLSTGAVNPLPEDENHPPGGNNPSTEDEDPYTGGEDTPGKDLNAPEKNTKYSYQKFTDIEERPAAPAIDETVKYIKAHLGTNRVLLEVIQSAVDYIKDKSKDSKITKDDFNEDNLCNFKIRNKLDLGAFAEYAFRKVKQLATSKDKKGETIPMESIAAWAYDNLRDIGTARALVLELTTTRIDPVAKEPKEVGNFIRQRFPTTDEYGLPYEGKNNRESFELLHKTLKETQKKVPNVEMILKFKIHNRAIIDKAIGYYGEKRLTSLNKAKFWDTFSNAKELEAYIDTAENSISPDYNAHSYLSATLSKKAILEHLLPALTYNLKQSIQMHEVKVDNIPADICLSTVFERLYSLTARDPQPKDVVRENTFLKNVRYQANGTDDDNEVFYKYLNEIAPYYNDTAIDDLDKDFFEKVNDMLVSNMRACGPLETHLSSNEITDSSSLKKFLGQVSDWLINNEPKAIQKAKSAKGGTAPLDVCNINKRERNTNQSAGNDRKAKTQKTTGDIDTTVQNIVSATSAIPASNFNQEMATIREANAVAFKTRFKNSCSLCVTFGYSKKNKASVNHSFENCTLAPLLDITSESEVRAVNIEGALLHKISAALKNAKSREQEPKSRYNDRDHSNRDSDRRRGYQGYNFDPDYYKKKYSRDRDRDDRDYRYRREYRDYRDNRDRDRDRDNDRDRDRHDKDKSPESDKRE